jgi:hypothetical protein
MLVHDAGYPPGGIGCLNYGVMLCHCRRDWLFKKNVLFPVECSQCELLSATRWSANGHKIHVL